MRYSTTSVPPGAAGTEAKLRVMRRLVEESVRDPAFRSAALRIVRDARVPERDADGEIRAISRFVRSMRYQRDPALAELFVEPRTLARLVAAGSPDAAGDCDDSAMLGAALHEALGRRTRFAVGGDEPGRWRHVWIEVEHPRRGWIAVDDVVRGLAPGTWRPEAVLGAAARYDLGAMRTIHYQPRARLCYGGASGHVEQLEGFKLKKVLKKATSAVTQTYKAVLKAPIQAWSAVTAPVAKAVGAKKLATAIKRVEKQTSGFIDSPALMQVGATIAGAVVGAPIIASGLQMVAGQTAVFTPSGAQQQPSTPPSVLATNPLPPSGGGAFVDGGGGSFGPSSVAGDDNTTRYLLIGAAVVAAALLFRRR